MKNGTLVGNCLVCREPIISPRRVYCSDECARTEATRKEREGMSQFNPPDLVNTGTRGAISELRVAADLLERGFEVFRSVSPSSPCDFAIFRDGELLRLEVRTGHYDRSGKPYKYSYFDRSKADVLAMVYKDKICYNPVIL